ncbi:MAG: adenylate/guanylate cyclase domain-containing protein [Pseudomonadota bacterium]
MTPTGPTTLSQTLIAHVADWLMRQALEETDIERVVMGCCERLRAAGIPLTRGYFAFPTLHPLHNAIGITWSDGVGTTVANYPHVPGGVSDSYRRSPHYYMFERDLDFMRIRLDGNERTYKFPVLEELREAGVRDYIAFGVRLQGPSTMGLLGSWATNHIDGFSDEAIAALLRVRDRLAVACLMAIKNALMTNITRTYLGTGTGCNVLSGQIKRGDGESIDAIIWHADIRGSTQMADSGEHQAYIDALNAFFEVMGGPIKDAGGDILSFSGDSLLALFRPTGDDQRPGEVMTRVFDAARDAVAQMETLNADRVAKGENEIGYGIGLHCGTVTYGNVGTPERLSFSVFGASVNEVARLEKLTRDLGEKIVVSETAAALAPLPLVDRGTHPLRGVGRDMRVFTPDDGDTSGKVVKLDRSA